MITAIAITLAISGIGDILKGPMKRQIHLRNHKTGEVVFVGEVDDNDFLGPMDKTHENWNQFEANCFLSELKHRVSEECNLPLGLWRDVHADESDDNFWPRDAEGRHVPPVPIEMPPLCPPGSLAHDLLPPPQ